MKIHPASFRDDSGYIFTENDEIFRKVNASYLSDYQLLKSSGLLSKLNGLQFLIEHQELAMNGLSEDLVLKPTQIPLISYPYEWCFSQLKLAALLTLKIQLIALDHGMILKDASAFNIQFKNTDPVFIDTLSFTAYKEGQPWNGYRQFCEHFLLPLKLAASFGVDYQTIYSNGLEGIPLTIGAKLLPALSVFNPLTLFHIHLHAKFIQKHNNAPKASTALRKISKNNLVAMVHQLHDGIESLAVRRQKTVWGNYDQQTHYSQASREAKSQIVRQFVDSANARVVWDLGANDGHFSRVIQNGKRIILSLDGDRMAVEKNFQATSNLKAAAVYPLVFDIVNPSANIGWANEERSMLVERNKPDTLLALAVIHHLVITHNIPFSKVAGYFAQLAKFLVIEFVPPSDEKILPLPDNAGKNGYSRKNFDDAFLRLFDLIEERILPGSNRSLLMLKRKV